VGTVVVFEAMAVFLTLLLGVVAGLGVLNAVLLDTRERVRDLGICKAVGMSPGQTLVRVVTSVVGIGLVAGVIGVPIGYLLHHAVLPIVLHAAGSNTPPQVRDVYQVLELLLLGLAGLAMAVLGAVFPAGWAARARTAVALRAE
jgi:putative ABC transport system permease protein